MLKVLYAGSPEASAKTLRLLKEKENSLDYKIVGVLTNPPTAKGRHKALIPTFVAQAAEEYDLPVISPEHLDSAAREETQKLGADILVSFAYGHIFGPKFLELFKFGGINLHPSALPKYRGCSPINAAILNGDTETAFSVQKLDLKMDEGNLLAQEIVSLEKTETAGALLDKAAACGAALIAGVLSEISKTGVLPEGIPQAGEASYTTFIKKEDAKIDWNVSAEIVDRKVRAFNPEPVAWTTENNLPLKIISGVPLEKSEEQNLCGEENAEPGTVVCVLKGRGIAVKCGEGFFAVTELQRQGKNAMDYKSFLNGAKDFIGKKLGSE